MSKFPDIRYNNTITKYYCLCFLVPCPTDMAIPNGYAKINKDSRSVTYYCTGNFQIIGSSSAKCQQDGTWSSSLPKCVGMYSIQFRAASILSHIMEIYIMM